MSQGSDSGPLLFLPYTSELFSIHESKLNGYSDYTLVVVLLFSLDRVAFEETLNRHPNRVIASGVTFWE